MSDEQARLDAAIAALNAQRALLGDAVVDTAVGPLLAERARLDAARQQLRQVTVLFLDVVGSTALSQQLDPEDVSAVMDGLLGRGTEIVQAHRGRVLQYAGDNLLAAFGAERVEEDDAERAVHCGLELLEEGRRLGERVLHQFGQAGCNVRVGLHTGPVLLGGGVDEEGTIRGLTVNIAARMEQTAPHGALRISQDTWLLVRGSFDCEAQPPLRVKGRDEPILTYLVQRARPRAERVIARGLDGVATPLVGREDEVALGLAARDAVLREGRAQALTLIGEPGLGKSRLLAEWRARLEEPSQPWWILPGRCHPQTRLQPYGLLRDLLARRLDIADSDNADAARRKLEDGLVPWLSGDASSATPPRALAQRLGQLLGMDFSASPAVQGQSPQALRDSAFAALRAFLLGLARGGRPVALLLEDLHWADDGSLDFLADLVGTGEPPPVLLWATARPEFLERRPGWSEGAAAHRLHRLGSLDLAQGQALADVLLQRLRGDPQHDAVRTLLVRHAQGNPFYMEELVRMLRDDGVIVDAEGAVASELPRRWRLGPRPLTLAHVPTTLVGVLQARLDALPATDRRSLQQASIIGAVFWHEALRALDGEAPRAIPALRGRSLLRPQGSSAFEGATEEAFAHHLVHQVAYDTVLKSERRAGHAAAAAWLAERVGERSSEYLAITAEHYERAGDHERALAFLLRAANAAQGRYANATALEYTERALANPAAARDLRQRIAVLQCRDLVLDVMGRRDEQRETLAAYAAAARELGDESVLADVLLAQAFLASRCSDEQQALELAQQAVVAADRSGNRLTGARARAQVAWACHTEGRNALALEHAHAALGQLRAGTGTAGERLSGLTEVQLLTMVGLVEVSAGQPAAARGHLVEALELACRHGNRRGEIYARQYLAEMATHTGRFEEAVDSYRLALQAAEQIGALSSMGSLNLSIGACLLELGRLDDGVEHLERARLLTQQSGYRKPYGLALAQLGRAALLGAPGDAQALLLEAEQVLRDLSAPVAASDPLARRALMLLEQGRLAEARACADRLDEALRVEAGFSEVTDAMLPRWACYRVWAACGDARAEPMVRRAQAELCAWADTYDDPSMREGVLDGIALHRQILAVVPV